MNWTDERIDLLVKLWTQGKSAAQISGEMGGISRNAVIGKVHRLGIAGRKADGEVALELPDLEADGELDVRKRAVPVKPERRRSADPAEPTRNGIIFNKKLKKRDRGGKAQHPGLLELNEQTCRWPIGDPSLPGFHFCGQQPLSGRPYCREHLVSAYIPGQRNGSERILRQIEKQGRR